MIKQKRGITLVALIITIVVLLVLAGVVVNLSLGENGIITKAQTAVDKYKQAAENEQIALTRIKDEIDNYVDGNRGTVTLTEVQYKSLTDRLEALENNVIRYPDYTRLLTQLTGNATDGWSVPTGVLPWGTSNNAKTWTATEDCFLVASLSNYYGASPEVYVDGVLVANIGDENGNNQTTNCTWGVFNVFVKNGSVVSTRDVAGGNPKNSKYNIRIYGLQTLSNNE